MRFKAMPQDNCVLKCTPISGEPPIYVGIYVMTSSTTLNLTRWSNGLNLISSHMSRLNSWAMLNGSWDRDMSGTDH